MSVFFLTVAAQSNIGNSPYSSLGLGEIKETKLTRYVGLGEVGVAMPHADFINLANPAFLAFNRSAALESGFFTGRQWQSNNTENKQNTVAGVSHVAFLFPIRKPNRISIAAGITPYSRVGYRFMNSNVLADDTTKKINSRYTGTGGLNKGFLATGIRLNRNFYVGAEVGYLFGSIEDKTESIMQPAINNALTVVTTNSYYNQVTVQLAGAYRKLLDTTKSSFLNIGIVSGIPTTMTRKQNTITEWTQTTSSGQQAFYFSDTLNGARSNVAAPLRSTLGISYEQFLDWTIGADFTYQQWVGENINTNVQTNTFSAGIAAEWIPNLNKTNLLSVSVYRMGLRYEQLPYQINGTTLTDIGMNFGISFPMVGKYTQKFSRPYINLGLALGQRGTTQNNLVLENYIKGYLSFTLNDDLWFKKTKID